MRLPCRKYHLSRHVPLSYLLETLKNGRQSGNSKLRRVHAGVYAPAPRWDGVFINREGGTMTFRPKVVRRLLILAGYVGLAILHFRAGTATLLCYALLIVGCAMALWLENNRTDTE